MIVLSQKNVESICESVLAGLGQSKVSSLIRQRSQQQHRAAAGYSDHSEGKLAISANLLFYSLIQHKFKLAMNATEQTVTTLVA